MPIQVYSISTRGHNMGGSYRCSSKDEADELYAMLLDAVTSSKAVCELELNGSKVCFRTKDLSGFSLSVHMEETADEIKARQIAQIEQGLAVYNSGYQGECTQKIGQFIGGGLI